MAPYALRGTGLLVLAAIIALTGPPAAAQTQVPTTTSPPAAAPTSTTAAPQPPPDSPGLFDIAGRVRQAVNGWFRDLVASALTPTLDLLGRTVLATPDVTAPGGRARELWWVSAGIANTVFVVLVVVGGLLLVGHETVQTSYGIKEIAPRLVLGFLAANLSLVLAGRGIALANALSLALAGQGWREQDAPPSNIKCCERGTWNERFTSETNLSWVTELFHAKKLYHRVKSHLEARLWYLAALINCLLRLTEYKRSLAEFVI